MSKACGIGLVLYELGAFTRAVVGWANVQAHPTAPQTDSTPCAEADRGSSGAAPCSVLSSSENLALPRFELRVPNYNNEGQPIELIMNLPEIQVMIDQMAFQLYGDKYDPILAQAIS